MAAGRSKRGSGVADTLSGLTREDVRLVQGHWRAIEQNLAAVGVDVFVTMFTKHPEYQKLFRSLAHLPLEALRRHKALESHGATVMQALTRVVDGLSRPDADLRVMRDQGRLHAKWHVKEFHFLVRLHPPQRI
ncbi:myoglobin-like isoform X2 [Bacillus rossius redtenbacheri]|uniref:myoglobin-like isoform X2 n=1 Tax=Bacillus rossius redtenbacheri TaxID=93214 RepID=UPI002FDCD1F5